MTIEGPLPSGKAFASGLALVAMIVVLLLSCPLAAFSATNTAIDPGGGSLTLVPSGPVTVNSVQLALVKQARDLSGAVLATGANVTPGQTIYFVLYVDNTTAYPANDIQITDQLDESAFTYLMNSMETAVVPAGSDDAAIWAGAWSSLSDLRGAPDDLASITDSGGPAGLDRLTVGVVAVQANQTLNVSGNTLRAIRFRVTVN
ncbi:MAG: hypothetical protein HGA43_11985 [Nitrospirae bacterium]|nr:hypothetical protein [Nitrospirota bacterium]